MRHPTAMSPTSGSTSSGLRPRVSRTSYLFLPIIFIVASFLKRVESSVLMEALHLCIWNSNCERVNANNFLSFPFRWTHSNTENKDLFCGRPYLLDLCETHPQQPNTLMLCTLPCFPTQVGLDDLRIGRNRLEITLYCDNHPQKKWAVIIDWQGNQNPHFAITEI